MKVQIGRIVRFYFKKLYESETILHLKIFFIKLVSKSLPYTKVLRVSPQFTSIKFFKAFELCQNFRKNILWRLQYGSCLFEGVNKTTFSLRCIYMCNVFCVVRQKHLRLKQRVLLTLDPRTMRLQIRLQLFNVTKPKEPRYVHQSTTYRNAIFNGRALLAQFFLEPNRSSMKNVNKVKF